MAFSVIFFVAFLSQKKAALRNACLLLASYGLILSWAGFLLSFLVYVTFVSYAAGLLLQRASRPRSTWMLWGTIALLLLPLATYKLLPWTPVEEVRWLIILPLGISFYTFQAIGYVVDVHMQKERATHDVLRYALFLAFFPKFIAGPIERTTNLLAQLGEIRPITRTHLSEGFFLIIWGLVQKLVIAESVLPYMNKMFTTDTSSIQLHALSAPLALSLFVYADFSGYTDIARGTARLLGFDLLENFFAPYFSRNPREFWQRWHISLSNWMRDYVYIPLGGNRGGFWKTNFNILIAFVCTGLWHGLSMPFLLWGMCHGFLVMFSHAARASSGNASRILGVLGRPVLAIPLMFVTITVTWILFFSQSVSQFLLIIRSLASAFLAVTPLLHDASILPVLLFWAPVLLMDAAKVRMNGKLPIPNLPRLPQWAFYLCCFYALILLTIGVHHQFLYANF